MTDITDPPNPFYGMVESLIGVQNAEQFQVAYGWNSQYGVESLPANEKAMLESLWDTAYAHGRAEGQIEASKAAQGLVDEKSDVVDSYAAKIRELQEIIADERKRADQAVESEEREASRREALERQLGMASRKVESLQAANVRLINEQSFHYRFWRRVARYASDQVASHGPN